MQQLLQEYKESLKSARKLRENAPKEEQRVISGMITDLEYAISWIETGYYPNKRNKVFLLDTDWFQFVNYKNAFDPYKGNAYEMIENRIDEERVKMRNVSNS